MINILAIFQTYNQIMELYILAILQTCNQIMDLNHGYPCWLCLFQPIPKVASLLTIIKCEQCLYHSCVHTFRWEEIISMWAHRTHSKFVNFFFFHQFRGKKGLLGYKKNWLTWLWCDTISGCTHCLQERLSYRWNSYVSGERGRVRLSSSNPHHPPLLYWSA